MSGSSKDKLKYKSPISFALGEGTRVRLMMRCSAEEAQLIDNVIMNN
jgi:hypothetical protein